MMLKKIQIRRFAAPYQPWSVNMLYFIGVQQSGIKQVQQSLRQKQKHHAYADIGRGRKIKYMQLFYFHNRQYKMIKQP